MVNLNAKNLTLSDVHRLIKFDKLPTGSFTALLSLEPLREVEQQELWQIQNDFDEYLIEGKVSEGIVKFITVAPLMRLAGFYQYPIKIRMEDSIDIAVEDEDTIINGRLDILAVNKDQITTDNLPFWVLVIEAKNSAIEVRQGLPQLLAYAYKSLEQQSSVWGMVTNGLRYEFVYIRQGNPPTYQLLPELTLDNSERAIQLLQVLKAICKLQNAADQYVTQ